MNPQKQTPFFVSISYSFHTTCLVERRMMRVKSVLVLVTIVRVWYTLPGARLRLAASGIQTHSAASLGSWLSSLGSH